MKSKIKNMFQRIKKSSYTVVFLIPFITLMLVEVIHRRSLFNLLGWIIHPREIFMSYLLILGCFSLFLLVSVRLYAIMGIIVTLILSTIAYGSSVKQEYRGEPFLPTDLFMASEAGEVTSYLSKSLWIIVPLVLILFVVALVYAWKKLKYVNIPFVSRLIIGIFGLVMTVLFINQQTFKIQDKLGMSYVSYDQRVNYQINGLFLSFIDNVKYLSVPEPEGYSKEAIEKIVSEQNIPVVTTPNGKKPNVVVIMSEAFSDPTRLQGVTYSEDPIPNMHALQKEHLGGWMNVSVFGGGTANSEFEALTGMSTKYVPSGVIPYMQYITKPIPSIAWQFRQAGYEATAMTTWHNWFYKIKDVYKNFGFNSLESMEFFPEPKMEGAYIKDEELIHRVVKQVQTSDKPSFIYAVTMEGHGPYPENHNKHDIKVSGPLTDAAKNVLEYYANTVHEIDKTIKTLTDELSKINEPTIVVYFGDHLPSLGAGEKVYDELGIGEKPGNYKSYTQMYETPLLIWDNYSGEKGELSMSPSFLGAYLLDRAGVQGNAMTNYMHNIYASGHHYMPSSRWLKEENFSEDKIKEFELLQYDVLHGEQYSIAKKDIPNVSSFKMGTDGPAISSIVTENDKVTISGTTFTSDCKVFIDGNEVSTTYVNPTPLTVSASKLKANSDVVIHLYDSIGIDIYKSKEFKYISK